MTAPAQPEPRVTRLAKTPQKTQSRADGPTRTHGFPITDERGLAGGRVRRVTLNCRPG